MKIDIVPNKEEDYFPASHFVGGDLVESRQGNKYLVIQNNSTDQRLLLRVETFRFYPEGGTSFSYRKIPYSSLTLKPE